MSDDWPYVKREPDQIIEDFEKLLSQKEIELKQKNEKIKNLNKDLEISKNNLNEIEAKLDFATQKISDLEEELISSNTKLSSLIAEKEDLLNKVKQLDEELSNLNSKNIELKELISKKEKETQELNSSEFEIILNKIKEILTQKGFLSDKEYEKLEKGEEI